MILSIASSAKLYACSAAPRVSACHSASRISYFVKSVGGAGARRRSRSSSLLFCASNPLGMAETLDEKDSSSNAAAATVVVASSSASDDHEISPPRSFLDARCEQDLLLVIQREAEAGRLPINVAQGMKELYHNYRDAVFRSGHPKPDEIVLSNMAIVLDRIFVDVQDPFQFLPYHSAIREPFDYYMFGQEYIRTLIDFSTSFLGNISIFNEIEQKLEQGENVIFISNHQTEADPAVIALLLESTNPFIAENIIYVAGDRVVTDPLCKPFSMGRNLLCVYSKKHMNDDPALIDMKRRANTKSLKEMALLLRAGSKIIWIAPSGGRDRPDPVTKEWHPAPFDASSVDNMRRLVEHAGVPGHIYPLAVMCHDIMPPPLEVEKEIGERREISFHGVGLSVAPRIDYHENFSTSDDPEEAKSAYSELLYSSVYEQYNILKSAVHGKQGLKASTPTVSLTQPWK
ncbi:phospholipid/glycerol acyltransferase family protein [Perilla frutescens var. hirtella]|uniref:Glycerol-3-phosphate acyltransferase, chloroplastic n=1 Tax=Perilla frutescens var. hirtella TaxID=608512 RepID=A0AAD4JCR8_PERFH|nr:phospholipid/glycerol acyltransferase family protein [Perilla frutescens var. hirtella]